MIYESLRPEFQWALLCSTARRDETPRHRNMILIIILHEQGNTLLLDMTIVWLKKLIKVLIFEGLPRVWHTNHAIFDNINLTPTTQKLQFSRKIIILRKGGAIINQFVFLPSFIFSNLCYYMRANSCSRCLSRMKVKTYTWVSHHINWIAKWQETNYKNHRILSFEIVFFIGSRARAGGRTMRRGKTSTKDKPEELNLLGNSYFVCFVFFTDTHFDRKH